MTGRGIDQILPYPSDPELHEPSLTSALEYVELAETYSGEIARPVSPEYVWGAALQELERRKPDARIINLETTLTSSPNWEPKGINYRMNPRNIETLTTAKISCCSLANNHILDWGKEGLIETIEVLKKAGIRPAGAGEDLHEAEAPAVLDLPTGRVLVFSIGSETSGIPRSWAATPDRAGMFFVSQFTKDFVAKFGKKILEVKRPGDHAVVSIHWGENWGYEIPFEFRKFAHALIDEASVDLIHGHSSHHVKGIEVYHDKLILYGCGDLLNDYEGIGGYESFRADLSLMYFAELAPQSGHLLSLEMIPMQIRNLRLNRASPEDAGWLSTMLSREGARFGNQCTLSPERNLILRWASASAPALEDGTA